MSPTPPKKVNKTTNHGETFQNMSRHRATAAKAKSILDGRTTPDISDVINVLHPVLRHRIIPNFNAEADGISRDNILEKLLESTSHN